MPGKVLLGVCGGIAVYKVVSVASGLRRQGIDVQVVMTEAATRLVAPLTFQTLTGNRVYTDIFTTEQPGGVPHITLAQEADLVVIAPATANVIGKLAAGLGDDLLTTVVLATKAPVVLFPTMNVNMFQNPVVQSNLDRLRSFGFEIVAPASGELACGQVGQGRLPEPEHVTSWIVDRLARRQDLAPLRFLITAGPTREHIDPVRFLSNPSSGRMGYALAAAAHHRGGNVTLVSGPTELPPPAGVKLINVTSARQMRDAVMEHLPESDVVIKAAAVADYRPAQVEAQKIKKSEHGETITLEMVRNPDILAEIGAQKGQRLLVGFAAETRNLMENAAAKLQAKHLDMIVANDVREAGSGFAVATNRVRILTNDGHCQELPLGPKEQVADWILDAVRKVWQSRND